MKNFNDFLNQSLLHSKINHSISTYNPYEYPPKIGICEGHLLATNFSYNDENDNNNNCKCCGFKLNPKKFKFSDSIDKYSENGFGYSFVFYFAIFCIIFLIFPFLFSSIAYMKIYSLGNYCISGKHWNKILTENKWKNEKEIIKKRNIVKGFCNKSVFIQDNLCNKYEENNCYYFFKKKCKLIYLQITKIENKIFNCKPYYFNYLSFPNNILKNDVKGTYTQDNYDFTIYLDLSVFFITMWLIIIWNNFEKEKMDSFDINKLELTDFTIEVKNLPTNIIGKAKEYKLKLKEYFEKLNKKSYKVSDINIAFDFPNIEKDIKLVNKEQKKFKNRIIEFYNNDLDNNLYEFNVEKNKFKNNIFNILNDLNLHNYKKLKGSVLISLEYESMVNNILNKYEQKKGLYNKIFNKNKNRLIFNFEDKDYRINISRAHDPSDIIWENLNYSSIYKFFRKKFNEILGYIISTIFSLIIIFYSIYKHFYAKNRVSHSGFAIAMLLSMEIIIFNFCFKFIFSNLIYIEKICNYSQKFGKTVKKIYKIQLLNTIISLLGSSLFTYNFYGTNGLIFNLNMYFLTKLIVSPTLTIMNFYYFKKLYLRYKIKKNPEKCNLVQEDANIIFENSDFSVVSFYSDILFNLSVAILWVSIFPLAVVYNIILMTIKFLIYRYILLYRSNKKIQVSYLLQKIITKELNFSLIIFVMGIFLRDLIIYFTLKDHVIIKRSTIFLFILIFFNYIFGFTNKIRIIRKSENKETEEDNSYKEMEKVYPYKYSMTNPYDQLIKEIKLINKS